MVRIRRPTRDVPSAVVHPGTDGGCPQHDSGRAVDIAVGGLVVRLHDGVPPLYDAYREHAEVADEFAVDAPEGRLLFVGVSGSGDPWPRLSVLQRFEPCAGGSTPGVAVGAAGDLVLIGAGERLLAHRFTPRQVVRLWEGVAAGGFLGWDVRPDAVLAAAELELTAWSPDGAEQWWTVPVEPPWSHRVQDGRVLLDVMGERTAFPLRSGPPRG
jgi:hypothetical protein